MDLEVLLHGADVHPVAARDVAEEARFFFEHEREESAFQRIIDPRRYAVQGRWLEEIGAGVDRVGRDLVPRRFLQELADAARRVGLDEAVESRVLDPGQGDRELRSPLAVKSQESADVEAGGRKMGGLMTKGTDYRANAFELDAKVLESKIRTAAKNSQRLAALRAFAELDKEYQSTACYREVLPVVVKVLQEFKAQVAANLATFDARVEKRAADLEKMSQAERDSTQRALDAEAAKLEAFYQQEKSAQQPWVTPNPEHKQSLEDDNSLADSELQRLKTPTPAATDGGKVFRNAWKVIHSEADAEAMEKAVAEAEAAALPERYLKMLQDAIKASGVKPAEDK